METTRVDIGYGYSDDPVFDRMIKQLADFACEWRTTKTDKTANQYQTVLRALIILGFEEELPVDVELPERLMPVEYISLFD